jgi:hypothetical protein
VSKDGFIPHSACTNSSGDCFYHSRCLDDCRDREPRGVTAREMERRLKTLETEVRALRRAISAGGQS